jgi:hypothetical protein
MKSTLLFVTIIALAIFLTGCSSTTTVGKTFIGGTDGLTSSFLTGSPPDTTTDGGTGGFGIVVKLDNSGENDIKASDGYVQIWGLDGKTYNSNLPDFKKTFNQQSGFGDTLRGAVKNFDGSVLNGGTATVDFGDLKYLPTIQGDLQQKIWANICYKYTTKMAAQLCVKNTAEQALSSTDICTVEGEKNPQNSGAPIQITSLKESYAGNNKMGITLTIAHVGKGDAFFKDDQLNCNDVESNADKGKVHVNFDNIQIAGRSVPVVCQGVDNGYVRLFKDSSGKETTTVYCTVDTTGVSTVVEVPIQAELSYVYLQHISQDITIRHISK